MRARRRIANFFIAGCGLYRLHNSQVQGAIRAVLDEIDLQYLRGTSPCEHCRDRFDMYQFVNASLIRQGPVDFIEFGVFRGDSIREWISINSHPQSRFFGFDSFEGLPDAWRKNQGRGHFNVDGSAPRVADSRVSFIKGWFDATVPLFVKNFTPRNRLLLHLDADLYGSTLLPLVFFKNFLQPGSLLIFDEFYDRNHEFKAFRDFLKISKNQYRVACEVENYSKVCIELL